MKESQHQKIVISHLRRQYPSIRFFVNPFAGVTLYNMNKIQAAQFKMKMREMGAENGQPDILINATRCGYSSLAIELKKPDTYPFRAWRGNPDKMWINESKGNAKKDHILNQAAYLHDLRNEGSLAVFCQDSDQATMLIDLYMNGQVNTIKSRLGEYIFTWGRYVPEEKKINFLIR